MREAFAFNGLDVPALYLENQTRYRDGKPCRRSVEEARCGISEELSNLSRDNEQIRAGFWLKYLRTTPRGSQQCIFVSGNAITTFTLILNMQSTVMSRAQRSVPQSTYPQCVFRSDRLAVSTSRARHVHVLVEVVAHRAAHCHDCGLRSEQLVDLLLELGLLRLRPALPEALEA